MSDSEAFWNWSEQSWDRAEFRDACMQWQQDGGEVNLLLFALWHGEQGLLWDEAYAAQLMTDTRFWRETLLGPLRELRAAIKREAGPSPEYEQAKALELQLERRFQAKLCAMTSDSAAEMEQRNTEPGIQRRNVELLSRYSGISSRAWLAGLFSR